MFTRFQDYTYFIFIIFTQLENISVSVVRWYIVNIYTGLLGYLIDTLY